MTDRHQALRLYPERVRDHRACGFTQCRRYPALTAHNYVMAGAFAGSEPHCRAMVACGGELVGWGFDQQLA